MKFNFGNEFEKEFKKLAKKYLSLKNDLDVFCETLEFDPIGESILSSHIVKISGLGEDVKGDFYKVRRFVCKSIAGNSSNSGIRIIYKYEKNLKIINFEEIEFIEIYHKNNKENHDVDRIKNNYS
ncbi:MAG: hypothetical protein PHO80_04900 [Candidatus Gracilibacteria bacterium]|nr:hypothetical protein [Candidatus Gracilibacteria bacterium]